MTFDIHVYHHFLTEKPEACPLQAQLKQIQERLNIMPTQSDLDAKLAEVEAALLQEIQEITDALSADGVAQSSIDKLDSLKSLISGIVNPEPPAPVA